MRISLKFLDNAFTVIVLFLGTGAFISLLMDNTNPDVATEGSWLTQFGWSLIYLIVIVRGVPLRRQIVQTLKANKPLMFLLLLVILSSFWSADAGLTIRRGLAVVATTLFGLDFAVRYSIREQIRLLGTALCIVVGMSVVVELFFPGLVPTVDSAYGDAWNGAFVQKNEFARIIVLTGILVLMRVRRTIAATGVIAISVGLIALCRSKTALVVFVAMLILLRIFRLRRWGSKALIAGIAGILLVTTLLSVAIDMDSMAGLLGRDSTLTGRTNIWAMALENIAERPVLGYGYNAFWNVAPGAERINTILHWKVPHAHNGFIDLTLQLGIVGLVLYIGIYFVAIRRALNLANETQEQEAIWPLTFVTFTLLYQVTESTILAGNTIIWMVFVSAICSVTQASVFETADSTAPVLQNIGAFAADEELA